ncbi:MAG: hypothetical protein LBJ18_01985 [Rickettsiales bacterium]|jgi:hypothetical protein|nr:hypothetical protein [Rickettsiales bacterium]
MKLKSLFTVHCSLFIALVAAVPAPASECDGDFCDIGYLEQPISAPKTTKKTEIIKPQPAPELAGVRRDIEQIEFQMGALSLSDPTLPPLWDGNHKKYKSPGFAKTVDWRDGVPLWDDSVSHYRDKDYSDFFMDPRSWAEPEFFFAAPVAEEIDLDTQNAVADLLAPRRPRDNLWGGGQPARTCAANADNIEIIDGELPCGTDGYGLTAMGYEGCPFETADECEIWKKKPLVRETVAPRAKKIRAENMDAVIALARSGANIDANTAAAAPLVARYKMLMNSARACCTDGMAYELKRAGATDGLVYKFLVDDANFYNIGTRCLMMTDSELDKKYPNTATAAVAADVRNGCLCRGRQWFNNMLAPFGEVYEAAPEFAKTKFNYTYTDGLQRETTVSINTDVQNVRAQLALCP